MRAGISSLKSSSRRSGIVRCTRYSVEDFTGCEIFRIAGACDLLKNVRGNKRADVELRGSIGDVQTLGDLRNAQYRRSKQQIDDCERVGGTASFLQPRSIVALHREQPIRRRYRRMARLRHHIEKEANPADPIPRFGHGVHPIYVFVFVSLERRAEIENGLFDKFGGEQVQRDEHTAHPSIAIGERVYRLELVVDQGGVNERRQTVAVVAVDEFFEIAHAGHRLLSRRRHEARILDLVSADEILMLLELSRPDICAPPLGHAAEQRRVGVAQGAQRERKFIQTLDRRRKGASIIENFTGVRRPVLLAGSRFDEKKIAQCRVCPFHAR